MLHAQAAEKTLVKVSTVIATSFEKTKIVYKPDTDNDIEEFNPLVTNQC